MTTVYRADHIGSLLRPDDVLEGHAAQARGEISLERLREIEDEAILMALEMQRQVGIDVLSDGEYRRSSWAGGFPEAVDGYVSSEPPIPFQWRMPDGAEANRMAPIQEMLRTMPQQAGRVIGAKIRQVRRLTGHEAPFLREKAGGPYKVTFPAPSYVVARGYKPGVTDKAYASRGELMQDVVKVYQDEVNFLLEQGVPYIQIDNPHYPDYIEEGRRAQWRAIGIEPETAIQEDIAGDNACIAGVDRRHVTIATHICRGNGRSA